MVHRDNISVRLGHNAQRSRFMLVSASLSSKHTHIVQHTACQLWLNPEKIGHVIRTKSPYSIFKTRLHQPRAKRRCWGRRSESGQLRCSGIVQTSGNRGKVLPLPYISMPEWKTPIPRLEVYSFIQYCREGKEKRRGLSSGLTSRVICVVSGYKTTQQLHTKTLFISPEQPVFLIK